MRNYKVEGIIIKRKNFGEADRLITVFSKEKGKLRLVAKGSRRPLSKMAGHLGQMSHVHLVIAKGRNLDIITSATTLESYDNKNLSEISEMFSLSEIIDKFLPEHDPSPKVYELIKEILPYLAESLALAYFKLNFLKETGFAPQLFECVRCSGEINDKQNGFDIDEGGIVCHNCNEELTSVNNDMIKLMRLAIEKDWQFIRKLGVKEPIEEQLNLIATQMLTHKISDNLKSERFIDELKGLQTV